MIGIEKAERVGWWKVWLIENKCFCLCYFDVPTKEKKSCKMIKRTDFWGVKDKTEQKVNVTNQDKVKHSSISINVKSKGLITVKYIRPYFHNYWTEIYFMSNALFQQQIKSE